MWHASVARLNVVLSAVVPVKQWDSAIWCQAKLILQNLLDGAGAEWQEYETGDMALHLRRRLSPVEMAALHKVNPACPVFTHGAALKAVECYRVSE